MLNKKALALTLATLVGTSYVVSNTTKTVFANEHKKVEVEQDVETKQPVVNKEQINDVEQTNSKQKAATLGTLDSLFGRLADDLRWGTNIASTMTPVTQADLDQITEFSSNNLYLTTKEVSNLGLLRNLEVLDLGHKFRFEDKAAIDAFWEQLALLTNLKKFKITQPDRDTTNFEELYIKIPYLPNLETLIIEWFSILNTEKEFQVSNPYSYTDTGISAANLPSLKVLSLDSTDITDYSVLRGMQLQDLDIGFSGVKDISFLEGMTTLEKLNIDDNQIQDFTVLKTLPNLKELSAKDQRIYYVKKRAQKRINHPRITHMIGSDRLVLPQQIVKADGSSLVRDDFTVGIFNNGENDANFKFEDGNIIYDHNFDFAALPNLRFWIGDYTKAFIAKPYVTKAPMKNAQVKFSFDSGLPQLTKPAAISGAIQYEIEEVNTIPPMDINKVPTIQAEDKVIGVGDEFKPLEGVSAHDHEDGDITLSKANVIKNEVDTIKPGRYEVTYHVSDSKGATVTKTIYVTVVQRVEALNQAPVITANDKVLVVGDTFNPLEGVSAHDHEDGDIVLGNEHVIENTVNTQVAGTYKVTYRVRDDMGAITTKTITVVVNPKMEALNRVPTITASDKVLTVGDTFNPLEGVSAHDHEDGEIVVTLDHVLVNDVDTTKPGTYTVTYKISDSMGASKVKSIVVVVNPKMEALNRVPTITASDKVLTVGDSFNPLEGVSAHDHEDGDIVVTLDHVLVNDVDTTKPGTYTVTYKVSDSMGASALKTIKVIVKEKVIQQIEKPNEAPTTGDTTNTGDATNMGLMSALLVGSSGLLFGLKRKKY